MAEDAPRLEPARGAAARVADSVRRLAARLPARPALDLLGDRAFLAALTAYADSRGLRLEQVRAEAEGYLTEMVATHGDRVTRSWHHFASWMMRAHDVVVEEDQLVQVRRLDRSGSLAFVFSHRSYLDGFVLPMVLAARRFSPTYTFGGANLDLPVFGMVAGQAGMIFVRRATQDAPLYRLVLRSYIAYLARQGANLAWSLEGGRTRTGKLRPPVHGILRYLADAVDEHVDEETGPEVLLVPVSIVYDQLHEVAVMATEARGKVKRPENLSWLLSLAWSQGNRLGRAYLTFGEPIPLRRRMTELRAAGVEEGQVVRRVALDASHRINRATPVTVTAVVCLALLGADRALTFDEVLTTVSPFAGYIIARQWPVAGGATLTDRSTIRRALHELVASGVLHCHDTGTEAVWRVAEDQHLIAAFYRNTVIHILVQRGIAELALLVAAGWGSAARPEDRTSGPPGVTPDVTPGVTPDSSAVGVLETAGDLDRDVREAAWRNALALRDLLKFEFFFPGRRGYDQDLLAELAILSPDDSLDVTVHRARTMLRRAPIFFAHLVLRPFIDAYLVLADRLAAYGDADVSADREQELLTESLHLGEQWVLQRRIASAESVSLELLRTALTLARYRRLLRADADAGPHAAGTNESARSDDRSLVREESPQDRGAFRGTDGAPDADEGGLVARRAAFLAEITAVHERLTVIARLAARTTINPGPTPRNQP